MTTETALLVVGSVVVPLVLWMLTNIRQSLSNFGGRLGSLEKDVAVLSAIVERDRPERQRRPTRAHEVVTPDSDE